MSGMKPRAAIIGAALTIAAPLAWLAGEQHRENCIRVGQTSCSVLPWDNGSREPARARSLEERLNRAAERLSAP